LGGSQRSTSAGVSDVALASARSTRAARLWCVGCVVEEGFRLGDLAVADEELDLEVAVGLDEDVRFVCGRGRCSKDRECGGGTFGEDGESGVERPLEIEVDDAGCASLVLEVVGRGGLRRSYRAVQVERRRPVGVGHPGARRGRRGLRRGGVGGCSVGVVRPRLE
jgi:hypothetical protein